MGKEYSFIKNEYSFWVPSEAFTLFYLTELDKNVVEHIREFVTLIPKPFLITDIVDQGLEFLRYEDSYTFKLDFKFEEFLSLLDKKHRQNIRKAIAGKEDAILVYEPYNRKIAESFCAYRDYLKVQDIEKVYAICPDLLTWGYYKSGLKGINIARRVGEYFEDVTYYYDIPSFESGDGIDVIYKNIEAAIKGGFKYYSLGSFEAGYKNLFMPKDASLHRKLGGLAVFNSYEEAVQMRGKKPYFVGDSETPILFKEDYADTAR
jgi:hypothetical protein